MDLDRALRTRADRFSAAILSAMAVHGATKPPTMLHGLVFFRGTPFG